MNRGELAERNEIILRGVIAHRLEQLLDIFRLPGFNPGDYRQCYLMRHKLHSLEAIVMQRPYFQRDNDDFLHPFYDLLLAGS